MAMKDLNDLEMKVRVIHEEKEDEPDPIPPGYEVGEKLELFFSHGIHRRCRFTTTVLGDEADGWTFNLEHVRVENINLSGDLTTDVQIEGSFRMPGGAQFEVTLVELSGAGVRLSAPLPDVIQKGSLSFVLPSGGGPMQVDVIRPKPTGESPTRAERMRLRFAGLPRDAQQKLLKFISESSVPVAAG